ncbi:unnamed protein product [Trichobilharzia regenti]|nr:unnamed protein product [Trichobilharzia regenti]
MLPKKSLSTLFASFNTPIVSECRIFKCHNDDDGDDGVEYSIISKWNQIDILRKDNITYSRTHLITVPHNNHEKLQVKFASQLHFSSFGKGGYPSSGQQNNVWDIQTPDGCHRAVCIQPVSSSPSSPPPPQSCGGDSSFAFQEDWGEGNEGVHKPIICVLDITTKTVTLAPLKENNLNLASNEPIWTPDDDGILFIGYPVKAYNLGIMYCVQRVCRLYFWNMSK